MQDLNTTMPPAAPASIDTPAFWARANAWASSTIDTALRAATLVEFIDGWLNRPNGGAAAVTVSPGIRAIGLPEPFFYYRSHADGTVDWEEDCVCQDDVYTGESDDHEFPTHGGRVYSAAQLIAAIASSRVAALEEAAILATQWGNARVDDGGGNALRNYAEAARALMTQPPPPLTEHEHLLSPLQGCALPAPPGDQAPSR